MSRQFDEYMSDKFELNGELYSMVEPSNLKELLEAYEVRDILQTQYSSLMHDDDSQDSWLSLLQEQEEYIQDYLDSIGEFDNSCLNNNIAYLAKKNGMRVGDLETALGISAGYISRTTKLDSKKKLSIDVVWKIAKLFEVDIKSLLEEDLSEPTSNTTIVSKFLEKLCNETKRNEIEWESNGGVLRFLHDRYLQMAIITEEDDKAIYHPQHLNPDIEWVLKDDIFSCSGVAKGKELVVIPFTSERMKAVYYDFIFVWSTGGDNRSEDVSYHWEKAFYSEDDRFGIVRQRADALYEAIQDKDCDSKVSPEVRSIISDFLK